MLPSIVGGRPITPVFIHQDYSSRIFFQIAAAASYKKVVMLDGKIAIK